MQPIRTASEVPVKIIIQPLQRIPLYQKLAKKSRRITSSWYVSSGRSKKPGRKPKNHNTGV